MRVRGATERHIRKLRGGTLEEMIAIQKQIDKYHAANKPLSAWLQTRHLKRLERRLVKLQRSLGWDTAHEIDSI